MTARFTGRVAMITGGAAGIGAACAAGFAREGAIVVIFDRDADQGERTVADLRLDGARADFYPGDVADEGAVQSAVAMTVRSHGRLDVMHANAAIEWTKTVADTTLEE